MELIRYESYDDDNRLLVYDGDAFDNKTVTLAYIMSRPIPRKE